MMTDGMVLVALDHPRDSIEIERLPRGIVGQPVIRAEAVGVALDVGLVHHVEAVLGRTGRTSSGSFG